MALTHEEATDIHAMIARGRKGYPDFNTKAHGVVMLAADHDALASTLAGMPDGHKVLMRLADDPDALDMLQHRGVKLAAALGKYAAKEPAPEAPGPAMKPAAESAPPKPAPTSADAADMREFAQMRKAEVTSRKKPAAPKSSDISDPKMLLRDFFQVRDKQEKERQQKKRGGR